MVNKLTVHVLQSYELVWRALAFCAASAIGCWKQDLGKRAVADTSVADAPAGTVLVEYPWRVSCIAAAARDGVAAVGLVAAPHAARHWEVEGNRDALRVPLDAAAVVLRAPGQDGRQSTELIL